jgi:mRNA-degrading endonuclease toxin of MazEF toxin-antitoxin module
MHVIALGLAVLVFVVFLAGVAREPRSFGNAVLLGLALAFGALGLAERLRDDPGPAAHLLLLALLLAVAVGPFLIGCFLLANGVVMVRREGLRPVNLLSLVAGAAAFVMIGLDVAADQADDLRLSLFAVVANLVFGYVSFLLVSFVCYAFCYGLLAKTGRAEFVIVLGAGLRPDGAVPPLLASRLDRGRAVWAALDRRAAAAGRFRPLLIVSGGQGDDERVAEAAAMAGYLTDRGVPAESVLLEDQSRSTSEQAGRRPAVVVSGPLHLSLPHAVVFVVPITSRDRGLRHQIPITSQASGLTKLPSFARPEDARAVAYERLAYRLGSVTPVELSSIRRILRAFLDL